MVDKTTDNGQRYSIDGKRMTWYPLDENDEAGNLAPVVLPLRIKFGLVRDLVGQGLDAQGMFDFLNRLIPDQAAALDEMDLNDFQVMFTTWQMEYEALTGASLGESVGSSI
jgi:hypothetical protein